MVVKHGGPWTSRTRVRKKGKKSATFRGGAVTPYPQVRGAPKASHFSLLKTLKRPINFPQAWGVKQWVPPLKGNFNCSGGGSALPERHARPLVASRINSTRAIGAGPERSDPPISLRPGQDGMASPSTPWLLETPAVR